jgi:hypothetical protein
MNEYILKFFILIILSSLLLNTQISAQWMGDISINNAYDSNPFRTPGAEASWVSSLDLGVQHTYKSVSLSYMGSYTRFNQIIDRNYYWQQGAIFGRLNKTRWGLYAEQRLNENEYNVYDYLNYAAYLNSQFNLSGFNFYWAVNFNLFNYEQLEDINNYRLSGTFRFNKSFQTRTTFILGSTIYYKKYTTSYSTVETISDSSSQHGGGNRSWQDQEYSIYSEIEAPSVSQLQLWARVTQSITQTTGFAIQYQRRSLLKGSNRFVDGITYGYSEESQIFDDPMSYESDSWGSEITKIFPAAFTFKGAFYYTVKNYALQGIYIDAENYQESVLREDGYKTIWLSLQKNISLGFTQNNVLLLRLYYQWIKNDSNSYWYNYKNSYLSLNLEFQL